MTFKNGEVIYIYLDGQPAEGNIAPAFPRFVNRAPLMIGGDLWGSGFRGAIDDVRVYNRALSGGEVADLYAQDFPPPPPPSIEPIAYYPLNGDARDASENHLDGTLAGTTPVADRFGNDGGALLFNGESDRINCGNPAAFNFTGSFTLAAWVKFAGTQYERYFISKYAAKEGPKYIVTSAVVTGQGPGDAGGTNVDSRITLSDGSSYDIRWLVMKTSSGYKVRDAQVVGFWMTAFLDDLFQNYISENGNNPRALVLALSR